MSSKARNLSDFISDPTIDSTELGSGSVTTDKLSDQSVTPAKLHNTLDLSSKTVTLANDGISGNSVHGGVISSFASTGIDDNATATAVTIDSSGRVGVGGDPLNDLSVSSSSTNTTTLSVQNASNLALLNLHAFGNATGVGSQYYNRVGLWSWNGSDGLDLVSGANSSGSNDIKMYTDGYGGTPAVTIDSNGKVGIGNNVPDLALDVYGNMGVNGEASRVMVVQSNNAAAAGYGGGIAFGGFYNGTNNRINDFAGIQGFKENNTQGDYAGALKFTTRVNGGSPTERMRITSAGNVGIGTNSPSQKFTVYNGNILLDGPSGSDPKIEFHQPTNTGEGGVIVYNDGDEVFTIASRMATYGDINFAIGMNDGDPTDLSYSKMFIRANGTVGIGYTNPQNNLHIIGNSSFNGGSTGITIQTHDLPNAEASISLLSRNGSNDNKTVNIRNVSGTFRVDASSVYLPTGLPNNQPYNMAGVAVREILAPSQYATANYYWIRLAYLNGRIPWLITLTNTGGNYSPGSCTFIIQRSWDNTAFYKTTLSKTGSQYFTEVRMQSNEAGGNYYLEAYGYIASGSGGYAGHLSVTPLYDQSVVCEIPVNVYAVNGSNLTYTSSNQVL